MARLLQKFINLLYRVLYYMGGRKAAKNGKPAVEGIAADKPGMVYTAITGGKDRPRKDIVVFTGNLFLDSRRTARQYKILSHQYIRAEYSLWTDGNITTKVPIDYLIEKYLKDADMATFRHPMRDCIYDEASTCMALNLDDPAVIMEQMERYRAAGYPEHNGLAETLYILRRHTKEIETFNNFWWSEVCRGSKRDQLSFNYVCWKLGIRYNTFLGDEYDLFRKNDYFQYEPHLK